CTRWDKLNKCRQSKIFIKPYNEWIRGCTCLSRRSLRHITYVLTGHCPLNKHLFVIKSGDDPNCTMCGEVEDPIHFLGQCDAFASERNSHLGAPYLEPKDILQAPITSLASYIANTGRFNRDR